jgi:hypothetical protein
LKETIRKYLSNLKDGAERFYQNCENVIWNLVEIFVTRSALDWMTLIQCSFINLVPSYTEIDRTNNEEAIVQ